MKPICFEPIWFFSVDKKAFFVVSKTQIYELSTSSTDEQKK